MKIEILKDGLVNKETRKALKKGDKIEVSEERGKKAIKRGVAKKVVKKTTKKSHQKRVEDSLEKK